MYNRYVPQPDGSYRRNRIPDPGSPPKVPEHAEPEMQLPPAPPRQESRSLSPQHQNPGFLSNLLPANFDLGDLIVMLLLLLMAGDSQEERNTAILTMALYFIL